MRLCLLNHNLESGGAERHLVELARNWRAPGRELEVVLLDGAGTWAEELPPDVPVHRLSARAPRRWAGKLLWALRMVKRLRTLCRERRYDLVVTFLWHPTLVSALALRGLPERPLLVWSVQCDLEREFGALRDGRLRSWLARRCLRGRIDHFIAVSEGVRRSIRSALRLADGEVSVIENAVDVERVSRLASSADLVARCGGRPRLVSVGRLHPAKGMDVLLRAVSLLKQQGQDLECCIIGDGAERSRLTKLADGLGLNDSVRFVGHAKNPYAWLRTADIVVSPSRWETFGIAIAEAMTLGLPVVATATDGARDLIHHQVDGLLVPPESPTAMAGAVRELLQQPEVRRRLSLYARRSVERLSARVVARRYGSLVDRLLVAQSPLSR